MVAIGLYIRPGMLETPALQRIVKEERIERVPAVQVFRRQPKQVFLSALRHSAEQGPAYVYPAFVFTHTSQVLRQPRDFRLTALLRAGLVFFIAIPFAGALPDRLSRDRTYIIASVLIGIYGFIYFALLNALVPALIVIAIVLAFVPRGLIYGPPAALISEGFTSR